MLRFISKSTGRMLLAAQSSFTSTQRFYGMIFIENLILMFKSNNQNIHFFSFLAALPKRFYKNAGVLSCDGKYEITLDSKKLKTPSGAVFQVTNEPLAIASAYTRTENCFYK